jgi:formiminotetrahydrofolate cyclodeaminase
MPDSVWDSTLAQFRDRLAGVESVPAGVSTAAVSAAFALSLLEKVLAIAARRKSFSGDRALVESLIAQAREQALQLSRLADRDIVAYRERSREMFTVPMDVAGAAVEGLELCDQAKPLVHALLAPDVKTAAALLTAAVQSTLLTADFNLRQLPEDDPYREELTGQLTPLWQRFREDR